MKRLLLLLAIVSIPFFIVIIVNETSSTTNTSIKNYCTRACHNKGCTHFNKKRLNKKQNTFVTKHYNTYKNNIIWLKNNPFGLSYVQINLLLYVIVFPIASLYLLWRLLKPRTDD